MVVINKLVCWSVDLGCSSTGPTQTGSKNCVSSVQQLQQEQKRKQTQCSNVCELDPGFLLDLCVGDQQYSPDFTAHARSISKTAIHRVHALPTGSVIYRISMYEI